MHTRKAITEALQKLGVQTGDLLMVHASLKAIGPVEGGADPGKCFNNIEKGRV